MVLDLLTFHDFSMFTFPFLFIPQKKNSPNNKTKQKKASKTIKKAPGLGLDRKSTEAFLLQRLGVAGGNGDDDLPGVEKFVGCLFVCS